MKIHESFLTLTLGIGLLLSCNTAKNNMKDSEFEKLGVKPRDILTIKTNNGNKKLAKYLKVSTPGDIEKPSILLLKDVNKCETYYLPLDEIESIKISNSIDLMDPTKKVNTIINYWIRKTFVKGNVIYQDIINLINKFCGEVVGCLCLNCFDKFEDKDKRCLYCSGYSKFNPETNTNEYKIINSPTLLDKFSFKIDSMISFKNHFITSRRYHLSDKIKSIKINKKNTKSKVLLDLMHSTKKVNIIINYWARKTFVKGEKIIYQDIINFIDTFCEVLICICCYEDKRFFEKNGENNNNQCLCCFGPFNIKTNTNKYKNSNSFSLLDKNLHKINNVAAICSLSNRTLAISHLDSNINLWSINGEYLGTFKSNNKTDNLMKLSGNIMLSYSKAYRNYRNSNPKWIQLFNLETRKMVFSIRHDTISIVNASLISDELVAFIDSSYNVYLWNWRNPSNNFKKIPIKSSSKDTIKIYAAPFKNMFLYHLLYRNNLYIKSFKANQKSKIVYNGNNIKSICLLPNYEIAISVYDHILIGNINIETKKFIPKLKIEHPHVYCMHLLPNGNLVLIADKTIVTYNPKNGKLLSIFKYNYFISYHHFVTPDGKIVALNEFYTINIIS